MYKDSNITVMYDNSNKIVMFSNSNIIVMYYCNGHKRCRHIYKKDLRF